MATQTARPLHFTLPRILGADASNARGIPPARPSLARCTAHYPIYIKQYGVTPVANLHSAVAPASHATFLSRQLQRPCYALHSGVGLPTYYFLLISWFFYVRTTSIPVALHPVGRWSPLFHVFRFWDVTTLSLLRNFVLEIRCPVVRDNFSSLFYFHLIILSVAYFLYNTLIGRTHCIPWARSDQYCLFSWYFQEHCSTYYITYIISFQFKSVHDF